MNRLLCALLSLSLVCGASAATSNGNDFALAYKEAKTPADKKAALDDAQGRPHFFRYLQIMEMQPATEEGRPSVRITAFEPGSYMDVTFTVTLPVSLSMLNAEPPSKVGDAIAVTGRVAGIEPGKMIKTTGTTKPTGPHLSVLTIKIKINQGNKTLRHFHCFWSRRGSRLGVMEQAGGVG